METPLLISVDDHVLEPGSLWVDRLPQRFQEKGPRLVRMRGHLDFSTVTKNLATSFDPDPDGPWADIWHFDGRQMPIHSSFVQPGITGREAIGKSEQRAICFEDIRPGCYDRHARLADMDANHTQASLCLPTFPRFCGQTFLECEDRELALACVQAYNDWMIDEWCAGEAYGRLIPLTLIPLWDAALAAQEVRRCASKGSHAITFSEGPTHLGLPSIYHGEWNQLFEACQETETVINVHIGSSSVPPVTSRDAPIAAGLALLYQGAAHAFVDWLSSGLLEQFPTLRISLSEGQVGWMPYLLERLDRLFEDTPAFTQLQGRLTRPPSSSMSQIYGCIFNDLSGLRARDVIGMSQIMFEIDYPHGDSTWPYSREVFEKLVAEAELTDREAWALARGNAIRCFDLIRFGISE